MTGGHEMWELRQMQSLPLEAKIIKSQQRIREWYEHWDGNVLYPLVVVKTPRCCSI